MHLLYITITVEMGFAYRVEYMWGQWRGLEAERDIGLQLRDVNY